MRIWPGSVASPMFCAWIPGKPQEFGHDVEVIVQKYQEGDRDDERGFDAAAFEVANEDPPVKEYRHGRLEHQGEGEHQEEHVDDLGTVHSAPCRKRRHPLRLSNPPSLGGRRFLDVTECCLEGLDRFGREHDGVGRGSLGADGCSGQEQYYHEDRPKSRHDRIRGGERLSFSDLQHQFRTFKAEFIDT